MEFLDPAQHRLWKAELKDGTGRSRLRRCGRPQPGRHPCGHGWPTPEVAARFATDAIFHAIRLEPYLEATARAHPDLAPALLQLVATTAETKRALVHGDVSPKNILVGA